MRRSRLSRLMVLLRSERERARLNHILIPAKKEDRDRLRASRLGRWIRPLGAIYSSLSPEGRGLLLLTLLVGLAGLDVTQTQTHLFFAMLVGLLAASVAARRFFKAPGLALRIGAPLRVSVGAPIELLVEMENHGDGRLTSVRVLLPYLPWDGTWARDEAVPVGARVLEPGARATVTATATFIARGEHHLDSVTAAVLVPLGFALGPAQRGDGARFTVVPRIADVTRLSLVHHLPEQRTSRVVSRVQGEAEFAGVRPYRAGDALKHLHARTWARTGVPHVKTYLAERSDRVGLVVLVDGPEGTEATKEGALSLAAGIAARLVADGAGVADLQVDGEVVAIAPRAGRAALEAVLDRLGVLELREQALEVEQALLESAAAQSSVIVVTGDDSERRRALVRRLGERGVPTRWFAVAEGAGGPSGDAHRVEVGAIERGEALIL